MGKHCWGEALADGVRRLAGSPWEGELSLTEDVLPWEAVRLQPPTAPSKIVCVGSNYRLHCVEMGKPVPERPLLFLKPPSALAAHEAPIVLPPGAERVEYEGELGVVVRRRMRRVAEGEVLAYLLGCTVVNDVTDRDIQKSDGQFTRAKGFDTFCPVGPWIETDADPRDLSLVTTLNGVVRQDSRTSDMVFSVPRLVSFMSHVMTLEPGDLISTGTPSGVGPVSAGDVVAITIEGVGTLSNPVVAE